MSDSNKIVAFPEIGEIEAEAAAWAVRIEDGTPEDYARFREWQSKSPLHREAAERFCSLLAQYDGLESYVEPRSEAEHPAPQRPHRRFWPKAAVGAIAATIAFGVYIKWPEPAPVILAYQTEIGAQKNISLPDGTNMVLNTNSKVEIILSAKGREVRLARGEAYFDVTHDKTRPFTVTVGQRQIRDIGTAFNVRKLDKAVEVTVTKGEVELRGASGAALTRANAGEALTFDAKIEKRKKLAVPELNRQLAWREGVLIYTGEPLSQMIADMNRYSHDKIELQDPELGKILVGGYFAIGKLDAMYQALDVNFGIRPVRLDKNHVMLVSRASETRRRK
ncbi:transmembrane sensor [Rhizomicrobium palustre]|uniref:Transmembrane sensor n=1 Tax=Rhizomicrobium palustre TaxID=189966 RepID=A0A846MX78_9PROT|nr:FecR domain-containing protein [Rhizomicrobium palustre]NIK88016.1 transmembrane sensor [Rhizomicrobium palustre]